MNKKGNISLFIIIIFFIFLIVAVLVIAFSTNLLSFVGVPFTFAGLNWQTEKISGFDPQSSLSVTYDNFLEIQSAAWARSSCSNEQLRSETCSTGGQEAKICVTTTNDISQTDEFVILSSSVTNANVVQHDASGNGAFEIYLIDDDNNFEQQIFIQTVMDLSSGSVTQNFDASKIRILNNFDETYTIQEGLIDDVFVNLKTVDTSVYDQVKLRFCSRSSASSNPQASGSSSNKATIYNVITKENEIALCNAGEYLLLNGSCEDAESLILARTTETFESFQNQIDRIEERLNQKIESLEGNKASGEDLEFTKKVLEEIVQSGNYATREEFENALQDALEESKSSQLTKDDVRSLISQIFSSDSDDNNSSIILLALISVFGFILLLLLIFIYSRR